MARRIGLIWLSLGLLTATQVVVGMSAAGMPIRPWTLFWTTMAGWVWLALAAPGILWLARRFPVKKGMWHNLPIHVAAAVAVSVIHAAWTAGFDSVFHPLNYPPAPYWRNLISAICTRFHTGLIVYAATMLISNTLDSVRRLAQREADSVRLVSELSKAQLAALRRQLEPHFLFNTLNGIAGLLRDSRKEEAIQMIDGLSDLLRRVLKDSGHQLVPLGQEVEFLTSYMRVQAMRFGDRLKVALDIPYELYAAEVPPLILQPLVENAIVHGIGKRVEGGCVGVKAQVARGFLSMTVTNDGPSLSDGAAAGVGMTNTRTRLAKLYGSAFTFDLRNRKDAGVEAVVTIPWQTAAHQARSIE